MEKIAKTNAMRSLDRLNIVYQVHSYDVSDGHIDGVSVSEKCGENPEQVFKTLVTQTNDKNIYVFVIPVKKELDLKACAKAVGVKGLEMIAVKDLLKTTGYIRGGCSPIGMKKKFVTVYDSSILSIPSILVSGGKIGTQIELNPNDLIKVTDGKVEMIARD